MNPPPRYVIDASVAVKVLLRESLSDKATALIALLVEPTTEFFVPDLFYIECANIVWKHVQRGNVDAERAKADLSVLLSWRFIRVQTFELAAAALPLAVALDITAYDAAYVALAEREGATLVTADQKLEKKVSGTSNTVLWLGDWQSPLEKSSEDSPKS